MLRASFSVHNGLRGLTRSDCAVGVPTQPAMIRACQRLCNGAALGPGLHVLSDHRVRSRSFVAVWHRQSEEVLAAAHLIDPYPMTSRFGVGSEFDTRNLLASLQGWVMELGTIVVAPQYRGRASIMRRLIKEIRAHLNRMNISHVIGLANVPRQIGDNTLQAVIAQAETTTLSRLPVRPWIAHPRLEPDPSRAPRTPSSIKAWIRSGGAVHPLAAWNAAKNTAAFFLYMNVAASPRDVAHAALPAVIDAREPYLACALK